MKIKDILFENDLRVDNPATAYGDEHWLKGEQRKAMANYDPNNAGSGSKGIGGSVTGRYKNIILVPTSILDKLKGVNNEHTHRDNVDDVKFKRLLPSVQEHGMLPTEAVFVVINHLGEAYISEGNHRVAVAKYLGIKEVPTEIRYFNGGEDADGPLSPAVVNNFSRV